MRSTGVSGLVLALSALIGALPSIGRGDEPPAPGAGINKEDPKAVKPLPPAAIPDDPPPHEGAMINIPHVIEPPDLLTVEVLEALPGRPISGERLVRPDGTINLGFYGEVQVRGLTLTQAKVKIVEHLRRYLPVDLLGLVATEMEEKKEPAEIPALPDRIDGPFLKNPNGEPVAPKNLPPAPELDKPGAKKRPVSGLQRSDRGGGRHEPPSRPRFRKTSGQNVQDPEKGPTKVDIPIPGGLKITIEVDGRKNPEKLDMLPEGQPNVEVADLGNGEKLVAVAHADSDRVFAEVTAFNSKYYYVQGDVAAPGKMPIAGKETVLDVLNHAGGLTAISDAADIRLVRPARGGKPAKIYKIDLKAIVEQGDKTANLQIFPDDRVVVGRNAYVSSTIQIDRFAASFQTIVNTMLQLSFMTRSFVQATPDLAPAQREELMKEWFSTVWKQANQPGGPVADETVLRELVLKQLRAAKPPAVTPEKK